MTSLFSDLRRRMIADMTMRYGHPCSAMPMLRHPMPPPGAQHELGCVDGPGAEARVSARIAMRSAVMRPMLAIVPGVDHGAAWGGLNVERLCPQSAQGRFLSVPWAD